jgi:hypothetical protein
VTETVKKTGRKVLATDTAQGVVGAVVDKMEEIAVDKADDAADAVKEKAARAGGRRPPSSRKSKASPKSTTRKSTARKSTARKSTARKSTARKSTARKSPARKSTARRS